MSPDGRRAWRTLERVLASLAALALLAWLIGLLEGQSDWLGWIATGLVIVHGLRELMIGSENVAARVKLNLGPAGGEFDSQTPPAATGEDEAP